MSKCITTERANGKIFFCWTIRIRTPRFIIKIWKVLLLYTLWPRNFRTLGLFKLSIENYVTKIAKLLLFIDWADCLQINLTGNTENYQNENIKSENYEVLVYYIKVHRKRLNEAELPHSFQRTDIRTFLDIPGKYIDTVLDKVFRRTIHSVWSNTTLITGGVGGAWTEPPTCTVYFL